MLAGYISDTNIFRQHQNTSKIRNIKMWKVFIILDNTRGYK